MHYIGALLLLALAVKLKAIVSAIIWIAWHGERHAVELREKRQVRELTEDAFFASFRHHGGGFWPFGVKDHKLRSLIRRLKGAPAASRAVAMLSIRSCAAAVLDALRLILFQYVGLSLTAALFVIFAAIAYRFPQFLGIEAPIALPPIAFAIVCGTMLMNIAMAVEYVFGYLFLTDYALYFHMLSPPKTVLAGRSQQAVGLQIVVMLIMVVFATGLASVFGVYLLFCGFGGGVLQHYGSPRLSDLPAIAAFCAYYTLTTLTTTGYGDITPQNWVGVVVGAGLQFEAIAVFVFVLAFFWSVRQST